MPRAVPANSHEVKLQPHELIVTKTDPSGHITYANRVFMRIAEYAEYQLLGQPHNIIRHPDMPRGVFRLMWKTLQGGNEFFGLVKNFTASGNYYWVFANITPDYDAQKQLVGYYSVRRPPLRAAVETVIPLYRTMCDIESQAGKSAGPDASVAWLEEQMAQRQISYEQFVLQLNGDALGCKAGGRS